MANIILQGGLLRMAYPALHFQVVNIALLASPTWLNGTLIVEKNPYYRLLPSNDNYIEFKNIKNVYFLLVNERVIYQRPHIFGYAIDVALNKSITNTPYADFFRYY